MVNTVERHRQAVWWAMEERGEYYLFDDVEMCESTNPSTEEVQEVRGRGEMIYALELQQTAMRPMIRRDFMCVLSWGATRHPIECERLARVVIMDMQARGYWDAQTCTDLCMQMGFESGYQVPLELQTW
jgi:hypothetical protein